MLTNFLTDCDSCAENLECSAHSQAFLSLPPRECSQAQMFKRRYICSSQPILTVSEDDEREIDFTGQDSEEQLEGGEMSSESSEDSDY